MVAISTVATMVLGFGVWVHHMFATGLPVMSLAFFSAASFVIAVPSAIGVFAWIATIWTGKPQFTTPFLFFAGFILLFVIGGVSGFMTASVALDWQLTDTYFVVAHLHYVLLGINVFPVIGGIHYWFPKMSGRMLDERLGKWTFWVMFIGFNAAFFPMHISGLMGMPRRIYTYPSGMGLGWLNLLSSVGAFVFAAGALLFLINVAKSLRAGAVAGDNPWDAPTLEWATTSPPPVYNFATIPQIASRYPLWEDRLKESEERSVVGDAAPDGMVLDRGKETIGVTLLDAEPNVVLKMPGDSILPFLLSVGMMLLFFGMLAQVIWLMVFGLVCEIVILAVWLTPQPHVAEERVEVYE
ncbi:cbb3-type cytochrome c oxidase subunit I [Mesorhizobium sp. M7A.F.Ca.US.005.03.2.1]|uniref:cytochrome c oxidase subunit I n=1 Tax=Mesorhizobium sp. M7A.F.Ca.US.005.03.2.1 TaxID=2496737 RepID=UPI0024785C9A|nr:cbb3-type cytochrome c oxidase subunit I [Mesorhizobium sp. M7A.F.Ca.US.005.03.2.1]